jgi:hypothetical protein
MTKNQLGGLMGFPPLGVTLTLGDLVTTIVKLSSHMDRRSSCLTCGGISQVEQLPPYLWYLKFFVKRKKFFHFTIKTNWSVSVAHICNPSYSSGRDQKNCGVRAA